MNMRKIFYLATVSFSLVFASCSMNKDGIHTASLKSHKLQSGQELTIRHSNHEKMAAINTSVDGKNVEDESFEVSGNPVKVQLQRLHKQLKSSAIRNFANKAGKNIVA